ncbi:hypothetical protein Tsubulata_049558 [Turnera subulata]|uniref:Uncharacterized protein n=1 Tax=Turnera subulata TaxID=218843 RepID=A0A9Q0FRC2_9ROSI|nr:hypothetical protein Tsubulata_049558 [Turnera subulata]
MDFPSLPPSAGEETKKKMKHDHDEPDLHHAASNFGAISSSAASNQEAESVAEKVDDDDEEEDDESDESDDEIRDCPAVSLRDTLNEDERDEYDRCVKQLEENRGFYVDVSRLPEWLRRHFPVDVNKPALQSLLVPLCERACQVANKKATVSSLLILDRHLEYVKILKATSKSGLWTVFYLTFEVIDTLDKSGGPDGTIKTYQAVVCVMDCSDRHIEQVQMVRPEPTDDGTAAAN